MGGKGQRRREKNFEAAHGGNARLPPPPKLNELDAIPSKLRKLMQLKNHQDSLQSAAEKKKGKGNSADQKKTNRIDDRSSVDFEKEHKISKTSFALEDKDASMHSHSSDTKKRKRKRKTVDDLRFQDLDQAALHSRRKERKKEYFESKKKKQKKEKEDNIRDFPGREEIKFGEIVHAPPKLSFPKASKASMDASKERVRLQAVEAYRNRRRWMSRPGGQLPVLPETSSS